MSGGGAVDGNAPPAAGGGRFAGLSADRDRGDQQHRDNGGRYGDRGGDRGGGDRGGGGDRDRGGGGGGGYRRDERGGGGGYKNNNRGSYDRPEGRGGDKDDSSPGGTWRGGRGGGGGGDRGGGGGGLGDNWRGRGGTDRSSANTSNDGRPRPRLQLKPRDAASAEEPTDNSGSKPEDHAKDTSSGDQETTTTSMRDPQLVNSRAAAMGGGTPDSGRGGLGRREPRNDGPPPVRNAKFERMAEEEREKLRARREERGPPPIANSRFAAAAEADRNTNDDRGGSSHQDRGPPPVANSRFAAAADADRTSRGDYNNNNNNDRGPPPIANSRFAAAAEADGGRSNYGDRDRERGPPPMANSRFAAAAEADRSASSYNNHERERGSSYQNDRERGPPPTANSRFAAAAEADRGGRSGRPSRDNNDRFTRYDDNNRGGGDRSRFSDRGPPPVANSRFANAAARADEDNRERDERRRDRYASRDRYDGARSRFDPKYVDESEPEVDNSRMEELLLQRMKKKEQEAILEPKAKEHEANMFQFPAKALVKEEDDFLSYRKKVKEEQQAAESTKEEKPKEDEKMSIAQVNADTTEEVMREFVHGGLLGDDLKAWCFEKRLILPTVEKLLKYFLYEHEKLNPDPDCTWAEPGQYGAALVSIVDDDLFKQMQVLWAIQEYCEGLGFPSHNGESVVQSMFRSMYKNDLAEGGAFEAWKDDSETHETGKMTAIMQTVDWFNWLEEDDDDEEDEEY